MAKFKQGDTVKHKSNDEFKLAVADFAIHWPDDPNSMRKTSDRTKNMEFPICSFYNNRTDK